MEVRIKEVLVIDDVQDFAEELVDFIQNCGVDAMYALNSKNAIEAMKQNPIKIILLDYDLHEPTTGLDLFSELKKIDPYVQIIFISAVATKKVLYEASDLPFAAEIEKVNLQKKLPQLIPTLLLEYAKKVKTRNQKIFFTEEKKSLFSSYKIEYSIVSFHIIEDEYVFPNSWKTYQMINQGETRSCNDNFDYDRTFELSHSFQLSLDFESCIDPIQLFNLKTTLSSNMEKLIKSGYSEKIKTTINWMKELSLGGKNSDPTIVSRYYDYAQLYKQIKIFVRKYCSCCNCESITPLTVYFPLASIKYRIREYHTEKEPTTIDSGVYNA